MMVSQRPGSMVGLTIDGRQLQAAEGSYVLQAARNAGIDIPTLCAHPDLEPAGACRLCMVEVTHPSWNGWKGLMAACMYPITAGIEVSTRSPTVLRVRRGVLGLLAARCPNSKAIADLAKKHGAGTDGLAIDPNADNCIVCGLCTRVCETYATSAIATTWRGARKSVSTFADAPADDCVGCGACVSVCPTGQLTDHRLGGDYAIWGKTFPPALCAVDETKCMACGACEEACPFSVARVALRRDGTLAAHISADHCRGCGACVGACPSAAIHPASDRVDQASSAPNIVIACSRSNLRNATEPDTHVVEVPCAGWVTHADLLAPFARKARGVAVFGRHESTCRFDGAEAPARDRVAQVREVLELVGMQPDRLIFDEPAPGPSGPLMSVRAFRDRLDALGPTPLRDAAPDDLLARKGLDGVLALLEWMSLREELELAPSRWLQSHGLPSPTPGGPVLLAGATPFLSILANALVRPIRLTDPLHAGVQVLRFFGHAQPGVQLGPWSGALRPAALADGASVFALCRYHNEALAKRGVHVTSLDDLLIARGHELPRPPSRSAVACDGSPLQVQLLDTLGYRAVNVGPDPLPDTFTFSPVLRKLAGDRLRHAEAEGAVAILAAGPKSLARWAMLCRKGTWRSSRVLPVLGVQLARLQILRIELTHKAIVAPHHALLPQEVAS